MIITDAAADLTAELVMIVNATCYPSVFELVPRAETDRILANPGGYSHNFALPQRQAGAPYGIRLTRLVSPLGDAVVAYALPRRN